MNWNNFFAIAKWMDDKDHKLIYCFNNPAYYGFQDKKNFLSELDGIAKAINAFKIKQLGKAAINIARCLKGLKGMDASSTEVKAVLKALADKIPALSDFKEDPLALNEARIAFIKLAQKDNNIKESPIKKSLFEQDDYEKEYLDLTKAKHLSEGCLDLHGLNHSGAKHLLGEIKKNEVREIIFGKASHSKGAVNKMKRIVTDHLKEKAIKYTISHDGGSYQIAHNNLSGQGLAAAEGLDISSFYGRYYLKGLTEILDLRLEEEVSSKSVTLSPSLLSESGVINELTEIKKIMGANSNSIAILKPYNIDGKHWVGLAFLPNQYGRLSVVYIDSENRGMPGILKEKIDCVFADIGGISVVEKEVSPEIENCCGAEVVEELVQIVAGVKRLPTKAAVTHHMMLMQNKWVAEWDKAAIEDQKLSPLDISEAATPTELFNIIFPQQNIEDIGLYKVFCEIETYLGQVLLSIWNKGGSSFIKLAQKHGIKTKGLTIDQVYRKLALKLHPDKGGDTESFKELQELHNSEKEGFTTFKDREGMYKDVGNLLTKTNTAIKGVDAVLDAVKLYQDPSKGSVLKLGVSGSQLYGMLKNNPHISIGIGTAGAAYQVYEGEYLDAMQTVAITGGYTLGMVVLSTSFPAIATVASIGLTVYSGYTVASKGYDILYPGEELLYQHEIEMQDLSQETIVINIE